MLTNALNKHLNIEQSMIINTSSIIMFLKKMTIDKLSNQIIQLNDNTQIFSPNNLYLNLTNNSTILLRVRHFVMLNIFIDKNILVN
jgi:hypothetical protein